MSEGHLAVLVIQIGIDRAQFRSDVFNFLIERTQPAGFDSLSEKVGLDGFGG